MMSYEVASDELKPIVITPTDANPGIHKRSKQNNTSANEKTATKCRTVQNTIKTLPENNKNLAKTNFKKNNQKQGNLLSSMFCF